MAFLIWKMFLSLSDMANWFGSSISIFTGTPSLFQRKYIPYITNYGRLMFSDTVDGGNPAPVDR